MNLINPAFSTIITTQQSFLNIKLFNEKIFLILNRLFEFLLHNLKCTPIL